jgi:uncharacterized membrane protein
MKFNITTECKNWVNENIITTSQAEKICDKYNKDYHNPKTSSIGYLVLTILAYLFIGIASILLISANWEDIPRIIRTAFLIITTFGVNLYASFKYKTKPESATALFFLGSLFYGTSIILIAQIYHLGEHMPDGVFWWALGVLPLAFLTKSNYLMLLSFVLATIWFNLELLEFENQKPFYAVFALSSLYGLFKYQQNILAFIFNLFAIPISLAISFVILFGHLDIGSYWLIFLSVIFLIYSFSFILEKSKQVKLQIYSKILKFTAILIMAINLLIFSFEDVWSGDAFSLNFMSEKIPTIISSGLFFLSSLIIIYYKKYLSLAWSFLFVLTAIFQLIAIENNALYLQIIYNIAFVIFSISLIFIGVHKSLSSYFFLGVIFVLFFAFIRYIDLIGGYVGSSILFVVLAIIMLVSAKFWKARV